MADVFVPDLVQLRSGNGLGLGFIGDEAPVRDAVVLVGPCHHILLVDLVRPPADHSQPVFDSPDGKTLVKPELDQCLDVFWFQRSVGHLAITKALKFVGRLCQHALTINLGGIAALSGTGGRVFSVGSSGLS